MVNEFNFNPQNKPIKILSIDGGGMRGVITLGILQYLEDMTDTPAYELFDMVAGTSTGAIIAAGLAVRMSAGEILNTIYRDRLPLAFGHGGFLHWVRYLMTGLKHLYPLQPFIEILGDYVEGKTIASLAQDHERGENGLGPRTPIILTTTKDMRTANTYYVVSAGPGMNAFAHWKLSGAVAASSVAPIFFPPIFGNLVDGGVGAFSNPCLAAATEAVKYIGFAEQDVLLISLGTGHQPTNQKPGIGAKFWLYNWIKYVISESLVDVALQQALNTRAIYREMDFRRLNPGLDIDQLRDELGITTKLKVSDLGLDSRKPEQLDLMEEIGSAYARQIDWSKSNVMPWDTIGGRKEPEIIDTDWSVSPFP